MAWERHSAASRSGTERFGITELQNAAENGDFAGSLGWLTRLNT